MTALLAKVLGGATVVLLAAAVFFYFQWRGAEAEADREQAAHEQTVTSYRFAQLASETQQAARNARVLAEQAAINERTLDDYETRLADARARADSLRAPAASGRRVPGRADLPGISDAAGRADAAPDDHGLPDLTIAERLIATETAIRLEALQGWVREQAAVAVNEPAE